MRKIIKIEQQRVGVSEACQVALCLWWDPCEYQYILIILSGGPMVAFGLGQILERVSTSSRCFCQMPKL